MTHEMITKWTRKQPHGKVRELVLKYNAEEPIPFNVKRQRFLSRLKNQFGYANEAAIEELERLLRQFYKMNRGNHTDRARLRPKQSPPK